jgi:hypothetical protein
MKFLQKIFGRRKQFKYDGPNAGLVRAMHELALRDDAGNRKRLYEAILSSTFTIPTPELPEGFRTPGGKPPLPNTRVDIVVINNNNGQKVTPAFTDSEALQVWDPNTPSLGLKPQAFFQMVMETDIQQVVINPYDPRRKMIRPGGVVTRAEMDLLARGIIPTPIGPKGVQFKLKTDQKVNIGFPTVRLSPEVEESLKTIATQNPEIAELYLFQMETPAGTWQIVVGMQIDKTLPREREEELAIRFGETIQPKLEKGQSLDFLALRGEFGEAVKAQGMAIFRRF